jgi:predicted lysophospholipase L1 biosynthesis ABC-type transport system permease subunit
LLWPSENPVGHHLKLRQGDPDREVVGIVQDSRFRPLGTPVAAQPCLFLPLFQKTGSTALDIHVRTPGAPLRFAPTLRRIAADDAPDASLSGFRTLEDQSEEGLKPMQLAEQAVGAASLLGVLLALTGVFASSAYRVARQRKEVAIRIAIGARPGRVVTTFAYRGLWTGIVGACLGILPAAWGASLLRSTVTAAGVPSPGLFAAATFLLALFSAAAALAAARRIARFDPAGVLRIQ